jgi:hypothetical protein
MAKPDKSDADADPATGGQAPTDPAVRELMELYAKMRAAAVDPATTDALTQVLVAALGSGPSVVALASLTAVQQANGLMFHNAVANQQKNNLLGMALTAKCVKYLLEPGGNAAFDDIVGDAAGKDAAAPAPHQD